MACYDGRSLVTSCPFLKPNTLPPTAHPPRLLFMVPNRNREPRLKEGGQLFWLARPQGATCHRRGKLPPAMSATSAAVRLIADFILRYNRPRKSPPAICINSAKAMSIARIIIANPTHGKLPTAMSATSATVRLIANFILRYNRPRKSPPAICINSA